MTKISQIEIRACRTPQSRIKPEEMRFSTVSALEFLVLSVKTDDGLEAQTFGFAGTSAVGAAHLAAAALKPFFVGRDPFFRERHWQDFRMADRWWHHLPIYSYAPFDIACWLLAAHAAEQPLYKMLGAVRDRVPIYGSSLVLPTAQAYADQARDTKAAGWAAYKLHPPGEELADIAAYRACREAVGPDFKLMADPVAAYSRTEALRVGRELERLRYHWFEEPLFDSDIAGLRALARDLDIPVCATEVVPGSNYSTAEYISSRAVDIVRTDVSWKGGITPVLKTAHLAESFGLDCELHTAILQPLELVNLHCCAALSNCQFFEVLLPTSAFEFGLSAPIGVEQGVAILPEGPGLGIALDWDLIEDSTLAVL